MAADFLYEFKDIYPMIDGQRGPATCGAAYMGRDRGGLFWIDRVAVDGPDGRVWLNRSGSQFNIELFRAVEAAIYDSEHARDVWAAHVEEEKRDAA